MGTSSPVGLEPIVEGGSDDAVQRTAQIDLDRTFDPNETCAPAADRAHGPSSHGCSGRSAWLALMTSTNDPG
jgi:hypothetical protein